MMPNLLILFVEKINSLILGSFNSNWKLDREEAITAIGSTAIINAAISEKVVINHVTSEGGLAGIAATMLGKDDSPS